MMSGAGLYVIYRNKEINHFGHVRSAILLGRDVL